jgi:hypothetical protein
MPNRSYPGTDSDAAGKLASFLRTLSLIIGEKDYHKML